MSYVFIPANSPASLRHYPLLGDCFSTESNADLRHHMKIQDHPQSFYETFDIVIAGLDSIPARRWMNATMVQIAQEGNLIPLIDGGTEGMLDISSTGAVADVKDSRGNRGLFYPP